MSSTTHRPVDLSHDHVHQGPSSGNDADRLADAVRPDVDPDPAPAPRLIRPPTRSTRGEPGASRSQWRPLPKDLLEQASHRLQAIALLVASTWIVTTVFYHLVDRVIGAGDTSWLSLKSSDAIVAVGVAISLALYVYLRHSALDPRRTLDLGLAYVVATAAVAGVLGHWDPVEHSPTNPLISWTGVAVLLFAATLPNDPVKIVIAGLLAAAMNPIGMLVARARGTWPFESSLTAWTMHYPDFLIVGVALVVSRVVAGLGQPVARARAMGSDQLGELIGRGGMGEVYKATHRLLARPAAIKLIRPEMMAARNGEQAEIAVVRFHREAAAVAQLRSQHTIGLYDFGTTDDGALYLAMELLDGLDLETLVRQTGPLPPSRVVHILRQVCDSLDEAHARGLVHRDIKPANIHIGRFGLRDDFVKVLDFGLVTSRGPGDRTQLATLTGSMPGTPAYMAPEMAVGDPVDGRSDIYALGCVAYYLLTGQLVFATDNAVQSLIKRLREAPMRPSERTELPIPPDLETLVLSCLAAQAGDRPATAADLARALAAVNVEPWTDADAQRWWAMHRPSADTLKQTGARGDR